MNNSNQLELIAIRKKQGNIVKITILMLIIYIGLALSLVRGSFKALESKSHSSTPWLKDRVNGFLKYFTDNQQINGFEILFLGASDIQAAINPDEIDLSLQTAGYLTTTYNLGVGNFDGQLLYLLARRLREIAASNGKPFDSIVVKFTPLRATTKYLAMVEDHYYRHFEDIESIIYTNKMLAEDFVQKPEETSEIWYVKNILGESSPISNVTYLNEIIWYNIPLINPTHPFYKIRTLLSKNWGLGELNTLPAWNVKKRGYHYFGFPNNKGKIEEIFEKYKDPILAKELLKFHSRTGDIYGLNFSSTALNSYIDAIKELQKITPRVLLLYFPESDEIPRSPEAAGRLAAALNHIKKETGVKFLDLTINNTLKPDDYFDYLHVNLSGQKKLSQRLATELPLYFDLPRVWN